MATKTTDELFALALASLEADAARVDEWDKLAVEKHGRAAGQTPLADAGRCLIARVGELCRVPHRDMSTRVGLSFAEGRATTEAGIARLQGDA